MHGSQQGRRTGGRAPPRPAPVLRDRLLELLAFEARLAGFPESLIQAMWEAVDLVTQHGESNTSGRQSS